MRTLIRDLDTGTFFRSEHDWTTDPLQAFDFQDAETALAAARDLGQKNLELHLTSDDGKPLFGKPIASD